MDLSRDWYDCEPADHRSIGPDECLKSKNAENLRCVQDDSVFAVADSALFLEHALVCGRAGGGVGGVRKGIGKHGHHGVGSGVKGIRRRQRRQESLA